MEFSDWSDLKQFDDNFSFGDIGKNKSDEKKNKAEEKKSKNKEDSEDVEQQNIDLSSYEISDWNDLRKFDDDHDDDWFKAQEKKLAEQYGGNFIKVKYCSNGRVAYFCELCLAECNAKKSLELHCSGMKHLKKKDLWEKEGKPQPVIAAAAEENASKVSKLDPFQSGGGDKRGKRGGRSGFGYHPYDKGGEPFDRSRMGGFDGPGRGRGYDRFLPEEYPRDYYQPFAPPPPPVGTPDFRDMARFPSPDRGYDSFPRREYGVGRDREGFNGGYGERKMSPVRPRYYGDSSEKKDNRDSRNSKGRDSRDDRDDHFDRRSRERDRDSRDIRRSPNYRDSRDSRKSPLHSRWSKKSPYRAPVPPSPPKFIVRTQSPAESKVNLVASPAGSLLQKLSECCVKSSEDADLALNVVASLTKSLKEYSQSNNEMKIAELLMEAELKVGTVKALKVGMKMLSSFADSSSAIGKPEDFFNTLAESANQARVNMDPTNQGLGSDTIYSNNMQGWGALPYFKQ